MVAEAKYFDFLRSQISWHPGDKECPAADELNHYIRVPAFHDLKKVAQVQNIPNLRTFDDLQKDAVGFDMTVYYELAAPFDPSKKTILFIPGGPGQDHTFIHGIGPMINKYSTLLSDFNVIAMDHRGVGCSRQLFPGREPFQSLLMRQAAADIDLIRQQLLGPNGKISIWGGSYGTMLGQTYALLFPDKVDRLFLWEAFSAAKDFSKAQRKYETLVTSSVPVLKDSYAAFKAQNPEWALKFIKWTADPWYSYTGRTVTVPETFLKLQKALEQKDITTASTLVKREEWVMDWMMRSISCTEIFNWRALYQDEIQLFGKNMQACAEFEGQEEYFDYTESLKNIQAKTFLHSGFYDHVTPMEAMLKMHENIPHSYMYLDPHTGHGVDKPECFSRLTYAFFNGASEDALDDITNSDACLKLPQIKKTEAVKN